jgi:hypothetical protein
VPTIGHGVSHFGFAFRNSVYYAKFEQNLRRFLTGSQSIELVRAIQMSDTQLSASEQMSHSTVRLACKTIDGSTAFGTAFFFSFPLDGNRNIPVLVTNRHVIKAAVEGTFHLTESDSQGNPVIGTFTNIALDKFETRWIPHPDDEVDLCVFPIGPLINEANKRSKSFFYRSFDPTVVANAEFMTELAPLEELVMIGYPVGVWDSANNMPIFRRGVAATAPYLNYEGRKEFMIDLACFPGSSGSPVVLFNTGGYTTKRGDMHLGGTRMKLLGILYAGPQLTVEGKIQVVPAPTKAVPIALSQIPLNLGFVIKAERILDFEPLLKQPLNDGL